jgi:peptidoglycan LD-endopeptidase LytH
LAALRKKLIAGLAGLLISAPLLGAHVEAASYTVRTGDTLWLIANSNGMTVSELMSYNGMTTTMIYPGQTLQLPDKGGYIVSKGDTLWLISQKLGIPLNVLVKANPQLSNINVLNVGDVLQAPVKPAGFLYGTFPLAAGTYTPFTNNYADGRSWTPGGGSVRTHEGVDIFAKEGTPVYAAAGGTISNIGWNEYGGYRLTVKVDGATAFYYAHFSKYAPNLSLGGTIQQDQLIGYVGSTGYGPEGTSGKFLSHLHFGIYKTSDWTTIDPFNYLRWWELSAK